MGLGDGPVVACLLHPKGRTEWGASESITCLYLRPVLKPKVSPGKKDCSLNAGFHAWLVSSFPYLPFSDSMSLISSLSHDFTRCQFLSQISPLPALLLTFSSFSHPLKIATKDDHCPWTTSLTPIPATSVSSNLGVGSWNKMVDIWTLVLANLTRRR